MKIIQVIDTKNSCEKIYSNGKRYKNIQEVCTDQTAVWNYTTLLEKQKHTYLSLYGKDLKLSDYCDSHNKEDFLYLENKIKNIIKSYLIAKVNLKEECYTDYVPETILEDYLSLKEESLYNLYQYSKQPPEYETLSKIHELTQEISEYKNDCFQGGLRYNIFGTKTGRLTTMPGSFPILTLPRDKRKQIKSMNGAFVEFDFNAAEIRTMLSLCGKEQPTEDIHSWNTQKITNNTISRDEMKKKFFAWLYNPKSQDSNFQNLYNKDVLLKKYWDGEKVTTPYGRTIRSDKDHALNYILQSTTSDLVLRRAHEVMLALEGSLSKVAFVLHDSLVIDCHESDSHKIEALANTFSKTELGKFRTNMKIGKDFFNMKQVGHV
tara:strand:+ start:850 stop:1980 length:1131 start_codon:yes stop_codon:yes gene_type:complete